MNVRHFGKPLEVVELARDLACLTNSLFQLIKLKAPGYLVRWNPSIEAFFVESFKKDLLILNKRNSGKITIL